MKDIKINSISVNDVLHTLRECERNERYEGFFNHMLTFASELTGLSEDSLYSAMYDDRHINEDKILVNHVALFRERYSEDERWSDDFWVDATKIPSAELFKAAIEEYLKTPEGLKVISDTCEDFNWGDAVLYVPNEIWHKYGIYPFEYNKSPFDMGLSPADHNNDYCILVNQDEILIPETYYEQEREQALANEDIELNSTILDDSNQDILRTTIFSVKAGWLQNYFGVDNSAQLEALLTNSKDWCSTEILTAAKAEAELSGLCVGSDDFFYKTKAIDIIWDTDSEDVMLPKEIELPDGMEDEDAISDYLSDVTGYCHKGYQLVTVNVKNKSLDSLIQSASVRSAESRSNEQSPVKETSPVL